MRNPLFTAHSVRSDKRLRFRFIVPLALLVAVLLAACGGSGGTSESFTQDNQNGDLAPNFPVIMFQGQNEVGGQEINFSELIGEKPVVLNFWAGLCPPCRAEMPELQVFHDEFEGRALLIGIDLGQFTGLGNPEDAQELLKDLGVTYPAGYTVDDRIIRNYEILGMPTTVFIDAKGKIFSKWTGAISGKELEKKTLAMLAP